MNNRYLLLDIAFPCCFEGIFSFMKIRDRTFKVFRDLRRNRRHHSRRKSLQHRRLSLAAVGVLYLTLGFFLNGVGSLKLNRIKSPIKVAYSIANSSSFRLSSRTLSSESALSKSSSVRDTAINRQTKSSLHNLHRLLLVILKNLFVFLLCLLDR